MSDRYNVVKGRIIDTKDGSTLSATACVIMLNAYERWLNQISPGSEPLGKEFESVLRDNAWDLYGS